MNNIITSHRRTHASIYRNPDATPLTREVISRIAPSALSCHKHDNRSDRYTFVSSDNLLSRMEDIGFIVVGAQEQRYRKSSQQHGTGKHLLRFAHVDSLGYARDERIELVLINSHNGSCSYRLMMGVFRFVCQNGLIVGDRLDEIHIRHRGHPQDAILDASLSLANQASDIEELMREMKGHLLSKDEQIEFGMRARDIRMKDNNHLDIPVESIISPVRHDDISSGYNKEASLWLTFNKVQEHLVKGGIYVRSKLKPNQISKLKAIQSIDRNTELNRELWNLASSYLLN